MATNGNLNFTNVNKVTFEGVGAAPNAVIDTTTGKIGVGVDSPDANLHVVGNCHVSTNMELGGTLVMGTVTVEAQHALSAITATGNTTPHTIEFQNAGTSLVTTGNVQVGKELTVTGSVNFLDETNAVEQFPPAPLSSYNYYVVDHGYFKTSASSTYPNSTTAFNAFNNMTATSSTNYLHWSENDPGNYTTAGAWNGGTSTAITTTNVGGTNRYGHWLQIEFPYKIKYSYSAIQGPYHHVGRHPHTGCIAGSNDLTGVWTALDDFSNKTRTGGNDFITYTPGTAPTQYFKYFRLVIEQMGSSSGNHSGIDQWNIFGTREQGQSTLNDGALTLTHKLDVRGDLYYSGMIRNLEYMEDTIRSWNPDYWWDLNDTDYLEGGLNEGDGISYVHNKSGNWVDNYLTATNCYTKYINGRRFWTGTQNTSRMISRDKDLFGGPGIGDRTSTFHVACTSPSELNNDYYIDSLYGGTHPRTSVTWDPFVTGLDGGELLFFNGDGYGYNDGNTRTAGGVLGTGSSDTTRAVHCVMTKANDDFPSGRGGRGICNHISIATLTRGTLTTNLANVTNAPGTNVADGIVWGNRLSYISDPRHNYGKMFYAEMIIFKRNNGVISQAQVKFLQDYFRFKYQVGGVGLQYSG